MPPSRLRFLPFTFHLSPFTLFSLRLCVRFFCLCESLASGYGRDEPPLIRITLELRWPPTSRLCVRFSVCCLVSLGIFRS